MSWGAGYEMTGQEPIAIEHHKWWYESGIVGRLTWRGVPIGKSPMDLYLYQEVIAATKPHVIVETGTNFGGSALFFADMLTLLQKYNGGRVISVDAFPWPVSDRTYQRPRSGSDYVDIAYLTEDSGSADALSGVQMHVSDEAQWHRTPKEAARIMVVLDSIHSQAHVSRELELYADLVTPGCYLVVEDTNLNGHPVAPDHGPGPMEAVAAFLEQRKDFVVDARMHRLGMTMSPDGWLKRIA